MDKINNPVGPTFSNQTPIFIGGTPNWASSIGLFIINFGELDLRILEYVESIVPPDEFAKIKDRHLYDRVQRIMKDLNDDRHSKATREEFDCFFSRLEPIRAFRNHIAHGTMRLGLAADQKSYEMTLSLPRDLDGSNSPDARHVGFAELTNALSELTWLTKEFEKLSDLPMDTYTIEITRQSLP